MQVCESHWPWPVVESQGSLFCVWAVGRLPQTNFLLEMVCILLATNCLSNKLSHCDVWRWGNFSSWSTRDLFRHSAYMHLEYTGLFIRELTSGQITRCFFLFSHLPLLPHAVFWYQKKNCKGSLEKWRVKYSMEEMQGSTQRRAHLTLPRKARGQRGGSWSCLYQLWGLVGTYWLLY